MNCESVGSFQGCFELCWGSSEVPLPWAERSRGPWVLVEGSVLQQGPSTLAVWHPSSSTVCKLQNLVLAHSFLVAAQTCDILPAMWQFNLVKDSRRPSRALPSSGTCHSVTHAQHGRLPISASVQLSQPRALLALCLGSAPPHCGHAPCCHLFPGQSCPPCCPASESSHVLFLPSSTAAYGGWAHGTQRGGVAGRGSSPIPGLNELSRRSLCCSCEESVLFWWFWDFLFVVQQFLFVVLLDYVV